MSTVELQEDDQQVEVAIVTTEIVEIAIFSEVLEVSTTSSAGNWYYLKELVNAELTNGFITLSHGLGFQPTMVAIANNLNQLVQPSDVDQITPNSIRLSLEGYIPIQGTWKIKVS